MRILEEENENLIQEEISSSSEDTEDIEEIEEEKEEKEEEEKEEKNEEENEQTEASDFKGDEAEEIGEKDLQVVEDNQENSKDSKDNAEQIKLSFDTDSENFESIEEYLEITDEQLLNFFKSNDLYIADMSSLASDTPTENVSISVNELGGEIIKGNISNIFMIGALIGVILACAFWNKIRSY